MRLNSKTTTARLGRSGLLIVLLGAGSRWLTHGEETTRTAKAAPYSVHYHLGFDRNTYPGDAALPGLRKTFSFSGYWLNPPPGQASNSWTGKRALIQSYGFGFLVLFNGRPGKELQGSGDPSTLGRRDAIAAVRAARDAEGFPSGTVIFLDQEEGGRMLPEQRAYVHAWVEEVNNREYQAGIYCSAMPAVEGSGSTAVTAEDIHENAGDRKIVYWVYNDACPPSPGCAFLKHAPPPSRSGISFAEVWQFAQSPRRVQVTRGCPANYHPDGNCYAPPPTIRAQQLHVDLDSAASPDPSRGRR